MRSRKSILPGLCKYKESPFRKEKRFEGSKHDTGKVGNVDQRAKIGIDPKMKAYKDLPIWKRAFTQHPGVIGGVAPLPGLSRGLMTQITKRFSKIAQHRKKQSEIIQKSLEKKGYKFSPSKTTDLGKK